MKRNEILSSVVEKSLNQQLSLVTPYNYSDGKAICVGDVVVLNGSLDGEDFYEYGIIDFVMGCLVVSMAGFEANSSDELMILNDYYNDVKKVDGHLSRELLCQYKITKGLLTMNKGANI